MSAAEKNRRHVRRDALSPPLLEALDEVWERDRRRRAFEREAMAEVAAHAVAEQALAEHAAMDERIDA